MGRTHNITNTRVSVADCVFPERHSNSSAFLCVLGTLPLPRPEMESVFPPPWNWAGVAVGDLHLPQLIDCSGSDTSKTRSWNMV